MRCLWIAREYPYPTDAGDVIYSARMLEALRDDGADVTVVCRAREDAPEGPPERGIEWRLVETPHGSSIRAVLSSLPNIAHRYDTPALRAAVDAELAREWDAVVIDNIGSAWALPRVQQRIEAGGRRTKLVYLSHNHEASTRGLVAENASGMFRRALLRRDAHKVDVLERRLVAASDLITVNTPADADSFRIDAPSKPYLVLTPGYLDRVVSERALTDEVARRAVVVGSFDWLPKRMNLEELVDAADAPFARDGIELLVVGRGPEDWAKGVAGRAKATRFTGFVESVTPYLDDARIGIVAERAGGGFKHKALYYAFNRIPMAVLEGSVTGIPLVDGVSMIQSPTLDALARDVAAAMEDFDQLNRLQQAAFDACAGRFDWSDRGRDLHAALQDLADGSSA